MICLVEHCEQPREAKGYCEKHYRRWRKYGDPLTRQRDWNNYFLVADTGCWEWQGTVTSSGYAKSAGVFVHRLMYESHVAPIPDGYEVDHLCRNTSCVNPAHLEAVTPKVNKLRSTSPWANNARKTHCDNGHAFTPDNIYVWQNRRHCKTCKRERQNAARGLARQLVPAQ